ncbi:ATP synthase F0 subunit A [Patescibacteria group bacterium]|nr:MAG: ATP synthase F0 subunit A [Patescibacteria group bacterium]
MTVSLAAEPLFSLGTLPVTNAVLVGVVVFVGLVAAALMLRSKITVGVPGGAINLVESILEMLLSTIGGITHDRKKAEEFFPLIATFFLFILFSNWTGILPGLGSVGVYKLIHGEIELVPFLRAPSADLNFTIALALLSVFAAQWYGMKHLGFFGHWGKFFVPPWKSPYLIGSFVGILELVSEFAKVISFSFRLFGNVFAGEILLMVVGSLAPQGGTLPFLFLEIFVGLIQALVFALLTTVFLTIATMEHGDEGHGSADEEKHVAHEADIKKHYLPAGRQAPAQHA